jgi:hypothetical protein
MQVFLQLLLETTFPSGNMLLVNILSGGNFSRIKLHFNSHLLHHQSWAMLPVSSICCIWIIPLLLLLQNLLKPSSSKLKDAFSPNGAYIATAYQGESTITITNLHSPYPSPSQFIDTDLEILAMVLTGNVLLVKGADKFVAWLLTEEGVVDGIIGNTRADCNDSLWEISIQADCSYSKVVRGYSD